MDCYHADKRVFDFGMIFCPLGLKKGKIDELYYTNFAEILILIKYNQDVKSEAYVNFLA